MSNRPRRVRISVLRLMLVVAAIGLILGIGRRAISVRTEFERRRAMAALHDKVAARFTRYADAGVAGRLYHGRSPILKGQARFGSNYYTSLGVPSAYDCVRYKYQYECDDETFRHGAIGADAPSYRHEVIAVCRERAAYHRRMARKWSWSAWLLGHDVPPDPPAPPVEMAWSDSI